MKILVLGQRGMLGRTVIRFLTEKTNHEVLTINSHWGKPAFNDEIKSLRAEFIINGIGKIPQKKPALFDYNFVNVELPRFLETLNIPTLHPSTDCEFKGDIPIGESYDKNSVRDADDDYGKSKAIISAEIEDSYKNTKIIRTSIIGHEENTSLALLDWFLAQTESVKGYSNHYWNGITTLEWIKQALPIIENWQDYPTLNQIAVTEHYSKFDILNITREIYEKEIKITPFETETTVNKCLTPEIEASNLKIQLVELRNFFKNR
ncbi:MAG: hypothetical protein R3B60_00105 [Candidatus Paceibacterota bacterium]